VYQPYPGTSQLPETTRPAMPAAVRNAVKLMYLGAAASLAAIVIDLMTLNASKHGLLAHSASMTVRQADTLGRTLAIAWVAGGMITAALWIVIARACGKGRNWARITGTVFFGIATLDLFGSIAAPLAVAARIVPVVIWLIGLGAVVLLWRRATSAFFSPSQRDG
jgi:hypothetical protein